MKIVGIAKKDWANAGWNIFQALRRYGMDAHLINLEPRPKFTPKYDVKIWKEKAKANRLINDADLYLIFESGGTVDKLDTLNLKNKPQILIVNSSWHYRGERRINNFKRRFDYKIGLTLNYPIKDIKLGLQPVDERDFVVRSDYNLRGDVLIGGAAPFHSSDIEKKGISVVQSKMSNLNLIMGKTHTETLKEMALCDIFTHGIYHAYGYTLIEAAMMGIPCFGSILERDKKYVLLDGEYPVYDIGREGEKIPEMLEFFSSQKNREICGKKMRKWAMKYHSQRACYETYKKIFEEVL